jgi:hypothetical protein
LAHCCPFWFRAHPEVSVSVVVAARHVPALHTWVVTLRVRLPVPSQNEA